MCPKQLFVKADQSVPVTTASCYRAQHSVFTGFYAPVHISCERVVRKNFTDPVDWNRVHITFSHRLVTQVVGGRVLEAPLPLNFSRYLL